MQVDSPAPNILIVEDHVATARSLARCLQNAGYHTELAHSGSQALAKLKQIRLDGAVLDVHLPDFNGLVLATMLRNELGPTIPLLVLSGDTSMETLGTLPHVGATYFMSKPVNSQLLMKAMREWVPPAPAPGGEDQFSFQPT